MEACFDPIVAVSLYENSDKKKHLKMLGSSKFGSVDFNLQKLKERYGPSNVFLLPCGKCPACRSNYAIGWSVRIACEAKYHSHNYFLTLTYSDDFVEKASYKDFKNFISSLKYRIGDFAYFACKEYGSLNGRVHWHCIIMANKPLNLYDATFIDKFIYYHSGEINDCWRFGLHNVAAFDSASFEGVSMYVAKYTQKDGGKIFMSRNIGKKYFDDHYSEILKDNFKLYVNLNTRKKGVLIPQAFARWIKARDEQEYIRYLELTANKVNTFAAINRNVHIFHHEEECYMQKRLDYCNKLARKKERL